MGKAPQVSRATLVRAYFAAMQRMLASESRHRARRAKRTAERIASKLAEQDRPRYWWSE